MKRSERQIADLLEPTVTALELELWGVEHISQGRHSVLRIYIDSPDGISIEDCERVSRQVSGILDVEDPIAGEYTLEVSSPGADRRLFTLAQFEQYVGSEVGIRLRTPVEGRRKLKGRLTEVTGNEVAVEVDGTVYRCPFDAIEKANLVF
ncbi:MAG: ribosome maturation factor RimP [Gammaproteobacteria bacterium]|nr:ribosome maturation factor RimP [Pseudomonadales bacterium]